VAQPDDNQRARSQFQPSAHTQDRPVPRLTLLFFGATKDVPEAAEMVTAGTVPSSILNCKPMAKPAYKSALD
jgi:hypothetical protein